MEKDQAFGMLVNFVEATASCSSKQLGAAGYEAAQKAKAEIEAAQIETDASSSLVAAALQVVRLSTNLPSTQQEIWSQLQPHLSLLASMQCSLKR